MDRLPGQTFQGAPVGDEELLAELPSDLAQILSAANGVVAFGGGLHVRGVVDEPRWHSLRAAWRGGGAFWRHYRSLTEADVPFGQDAVGDQFFLRGDMVWRLWAETDDVESLDCTLPAFFERCRRDPIESLSLHPLLRLEEEGHKLAPGQLISVYPPFCSREADGGRVTLRAVPAEERRVFLAELASQVRELPPGAKLELKTTD